MAETDDIEPYAVADAHCPRCGRVTDTRGFFPNVLYCEPCDHQWINLANLPEGD